MASTLRHRAGEKLLTSAIAHSFDRQQLEQSLATVSPHRPGYLGAQQALRTAQRMENLLLWLAWRVQPRTLSS